MSKTVKTPKGTELPLMNLKGKDYLMVAYRLQWLVEEEKNFRIESHFHQITDEQTVCTALVSLLNEKGEVVKSATGTKRETKKDFPDHTEKAETGAVGRALAMLGYGTQFAISDLDEGTRLADAPLASVKATTPVKVAPVVATKTETTASVPDHSVKSTEASVTTDVQAAPKKTTFKKAAKTEEPKLGSDESAWE
jgi:hypothetical protein